MNYILKKMLEQQNKLRQWIPVFEELIDHPDMEKVKEFADSDSWVKVDVAYRRMQILMATEI